MDGLGSSLRVPPLFGNLNGDTEGLEKIDPFEPLYFEGFHCFAPEDDLFGEPRARFFAAGYLIGPSAGSSRARYGCHRRMKRTSFVRLASAALLTCSCLQLCHLTGGELMYLAEFRLQKHSESPCRVCCRILGHKHVSLSEM